MEYVIYCDESLGKGQYYSDFFGGALVKSSDFENVKAILESHKAALNLNNKHNLEIPADATERGKRTIAKEKLFYQILGHIRNLKGYENFEIYCDTPVESAVDYWRHPYRHWQFLANEFRNQSGV